MKRYAPIVPLLVLVPLVAFAARNLEENVVPPKNQVRQAFETFGAPVERAKLRVLYVGNSITRHAPKPSIGWTNDCGMAASALSRDYVHVNAAMIARRLPDAAFACLNVADTVERTFMEAAWTPAEALAEAKRFRPDIVLFFFGANVPEAYDAHPEAAARSFGDALEAMRAFLATSTTRFFFIEGFYTRPFLDAQKRAVAERHGDVFVEIADIRARPEVRGMFGHPDDLGMRLLAGRFMRAMLTSGALGADPSNETAKWQGEIDRLSARGGGRLVLPAGRHRVAGLFLKSGVTLELPKDCVLEGSKEITDYADIYLRYSERREPWQAIVGAVGQTNIAVVGEGTVYGNGADYPHRVPSGRPRGFLFYRCRNVRVEGITMRDLASWTCYYKECDGVVHRRVTVDSHVNDNNDGVDIDARNVLVEECDIDADDDGICLKSDNPDFICENVEVRNCEVKSCASLFKLGTGSHGGFRNIRFHDCTGGRSDHDYIDPSTGRGWMSDYGRMIFPGNNERFCPYVGCIVESVDGALVENVTFRNMTIRDCCTPFFVRGGLRFDRTFGDGEILRIPFGKGVRVRDVTFENIKATAYSFTASPVTGVGSVIRPTNILFRNIEISVPGAGDAAHAEVNAFVPEKAGDYPDPYMFDYRMLPAHGFYIHHADNVKFENVAIRVRTSDPRPDIFSEDSTGVVRE